MTQSYAGYPPVDAIIAYENGELDEDETLDLFSFLLRTGLINQLQGSYGRAAMSLIEEGLLLQDGTVL